MSIGHVPPSIASSANKPSTDFLSRAVVRRKVGAKPQSIPSVFLLKSLKWCRNFWRTGSDGPRCETISFLTSSFLFHLFSVLASEVPLLKIRISMLKLEPVLVIFTWELSSSCRRMKQRATFCLLWCDAKFSAHLQAERNCPWSRLDRLGRLEILWYHTELWSQQELDWKGCT